MAVAQPERRHAPSERGLPDIIAELAALQAAQHRAPAPPIDDGPIIGLAEAAHPVGCRTKAVRAHRDGAVKPNVGVSLPDAEGGRWG